MTDQEILAKAIQKAQKNGFMPDHRFDYSKDMGWTYVLREKPKQSDKGMTVNITGLLSEGDIIFNHDFAKALWGEPKPSDIGRRDNGGIHRFAEPQTIGWQHHLQQMVIADEALKYLEKNT